MPRMTISDAQLARMRAQVPLPDTGVVKSGTITADGAGGWTEGTAIHGTVSVRLDPLGSKGGDNGLYAQLREGLRVDYQLTTEFDAPLAVNRYVTINGSNYQIVAMDIDHSWRVSRRALVARID